MTATRDDIQQELAQFEPDPDGDGVRDQTAPAADAPRAALPDDAQWVEWSDELEESEWADAELRSFGSR